MKKYVLVTGGAGYIGSHTVLELIRQGYGVISIDNFVNSKEKVFDTIYEMTGVAVKNFNLDLAHSTVHQAIVNRLKEYKNICGVIHFAALKSVPESMENPFEYYHNNLKSTLNILNIAKELDIKKFIFSSSCSVYGNVDQMPVDETTEFGKHQSVYAHTKQLCEEMLKSIATDDLNITSLRYFNPVGADQSGRIGDPSDDSTALVPIITKFSKEEKTLKVFGSDYDTKDGSCVRDYIHVTDLAQAHIKALEHEHKGYDVFNIGTGTGTTVLEMVEAFKKLKVGELKYEVVDRREGDIEKIYSDTSKAETVLGFVPKLSVDDMVHSAWMWEENKNKNLKFI